MKALWLAAVLAVSSIFGAHAQTYPSRPITIIVPFPAGGPTDTIARLVADRMKESLEQPLVIENVTGAGSTIGTTRAIQAAPDGYTLYVGNWTSSVGANVLYPVSWHIVNDLEPVARLSTSSLMIVGRSGLPPKDVRELIDWLKANPGKASAVHIGAGSGAHVCYLYFGQKTGVTFQLVPYRGGAPGMQDLIAGHVDLFCAEASQTLAGVRAGQIKAYAVMSDTRWAPLPDVPALQEIGLDLQLAFWHGLWAPKGTPKDIVQKLNAAVVAAFKDATVQKRIAELGQTIPTDDQLTPEALGAWHKAEIDKWWPFIKAANIKVN
ncbi:MAG TPA: tripartite tricarboxylate transporter substrate-binding protein [Xanthobacteraceae bacterium]|nr:tripartite tricarboxylate transporter substrate-binding protein [Xanthobacteraceae bacterium]